jgi:hypothetical protein
VVRKITDSAKVGVLLADKIALSQVVCRELVPWASYESGGVRRRDVIRALADLERYLGFAGLAGFGTLRKLVASCPELNPLAAPETI